MHDRIGIPACFSTAAASAVAGKKQLSPDHTAASAEAAVTRSGQSVFMSVYQTKMGDESRLITVTWCKNLLLHGLSVSIQGLHDCKVELKPWYFWRKQGSKRFVLGDEGNGKKKKPVDVIWDLKAAKFNGETEPDSDYYVAVVCEEQVVLLLGDLRKEAYRKTLCRPSLDDPVLLSRKEHVFGKRKYETRIDLHDEAKPHRVTIQFVKRCSRADNDDDGSSSSAGAEPEMEIKMDGRVVVHVKPLHWKFRGNEAVRLNKARVEVYWDVHDWLFSPGLRHALFIFKPSSLSVSSSSSSSLSSASPVGSFGSVEEGTTPEFCLFLYAWKME